MRNALLDQNCIVQDYCMWTFTVRLCALSRNHLVHTPRRIRCSLVTFCVTQIFWRKFFHRSVRQDGDSRDRFSKHCSQSKLFWFMRTSTVGEAAQQQFSFSEELHLLTVHINVDIYYISSTEL